MPVLLLPIQNPATGRPGHAVFEFTKNQPERLVFVRFEPFIGDACELFPKGFWTELWTKAQERAKEIEEPEVKATSQDEEYMWWRFYAQDANNLPIPKEDADDAFAAAACIGCGACVAACKNASAMLFTSAKISQLALLPQGKVEAAKRAEAMVAQMDEEGFGACSNTGACEAECPKGISLENIARMNREFFSATFSSK